MEGRFREPFEKLECAVKREKRSRDYSSSDDDDNQEDSKQGIIPLNKDNNKLEKAKAEMGEVKEENQRLKKYLSQIMEDYKSLQKKFHDAVDHQQEIEAKESVSTVTTTTHQENRDLFSLCLGRSAAASSSDHVDRNPKKNHQDDDKEGLALGLDCNFKVSSTMQQAESDNSVEEVNIREKTNWPPGKDLKKGKSNGDEQEAQQQNNPAKKARVSVRVRCDTPTMNDGCQWRKYGQKIAKGNPCPRAYYRCTVSTTCPVRKQVQRCAQDMSILITTYEGTHNHPLPMSATAMASTTSAAASMLLSGSSTSGSNPNNPSSTTTPAELHGLNFYFSDGSKPNPYYPQNHSLSPSPSCPTITLDLTSNTISSSSSSSSPLFNKSTLSPNNFMPRYSTTNLNFSSWNNMNGSGGLAYGANSQQQPYIKNQIGSVNFGRHPHQESLIYQSYMQKNMPAASSTQQQQSLQANYTIEAATKAITSDPNFQSALQAALSSIINSSGVVGGGGTGSGSGGGGDTKFGKNSTSKSKSTSPEDDS